MKNIEILELNLRKNIKEAEDILESLKFGDIKTILSKIKGTSNNSTAVYLVVRSVLDSQVEPIRKELKEMIVEYLKEVLKEHEDIEFIIEESSLDLLPNNIIVRNEDIDVFEINLYNSNYHICIEEGSSQCKGLSSVKNDFSAVIRMVDRELITKKENHPDVVNFIQCRTDLKRKVDYMEKHLEENIQIAAKLMTVFDEYNFYNYTQFNNSLIYNKIIDRKEEVNVR